MSGRVKLRNTGRVAGLRRARRADIPSDMHLVIVDVEMDLSIEDLAIDLVREDNDMIDYLVDARKTSGYTVADVAARLGTDEAMVEEFESLSIEPSLTEIRMYALAIGASVQHVVTPGVVSPDELGFTS